MESEEAGGDRVRLQPERQPIFNVPAAVLATVLLLAIVHAVRVFALGGEGEDWLITNFAFIPGCYETACTSYYGYPRLAGAAIWTPLTHALLHGDWVHFGLNAIWLLAFGTPVARRIGAWRYALFCIAGALAGAALFFAVNPTLLEPVVGASGIVSALMGGACRFAFGSSRRLDEMATETPLLPIFRALADRTVLVFVLVFFATNLATATSLGSFMSGGAAIAWEAHLGGFAFGFLCFGLFERRAAP